ncbi:hypothetical protein J4216_03110 [Candidatus Woesearchaeota archaeon]|nr:hypothetical protein [Candidatus Woesearchaeota archaeon]
MKFIIEHLEKEVYDWCIIEYTNISKIVGKNNLIFTNIKSKKDKEILKNLGEVKEESVIKLKLKNACLLDPKAPKSLNPTDKFDYFIFGGILGDYPEQGRTEKYLTSKLKNIELRNLKEFQMSTDTAVLTTYKIVKEKTPIEKINFIDKPIIKLKNGKFQEEIELPYRYILRNNKAIISKKLITYLKNKEDL